MTTSPDQRVLAVLALADELPTVDELAPFLTDPAGEVRRTALRVLVELAPPDAGAALAAALLDDLEDVRRAAVEGVLELRELVVADESFCRNLEHVAGSPHGDVRALRLQLMRELRIGNRSTFVDGLGDQHPLVRTRAIAGLVALGDGAAIAGHDDSDPLVRLAAARALGTLADPAAAQRLLELSDDADLRVRAAALEAIAAVGCCPPLAEKAIGATRHREWSIRKGAAIALRTASKELAVGPLLALLQDENLDVRRATVQSLAGWVGDVNRVATALAGMSDDVDADVRAYARMALEVGGGHPVH